MLIEIRFFNGYYGADQDRNREWPPSPGRLFSALINTFSIMAKNVASDRTILQWFESLMAPEIIYPEAIEKEYTPVVVYVPVNSYKDKGTFLHPTRLERQFPSVHAYDDRLYYSWPGVEPHPQMEQLLSYFSCFGTSRSMMEARLVQELPEEAKSFIHLKPTDNGLGKRLSCYHPGRLAISDSAYEQNIKTTPTHHVGYKQYKAPMPSLAQISTFFKLSGPYLVHGVEAALLASAVRGRLLNIARQLDLTPNALIGKDSKSPHMAFLPLPFVGHRFATGMIMGMNITMPKLVDPQELQDCMQIMHQFIVEGGTVKYRNEEWTLSPVPDNDMTPYTLRPAAWNRSSQFWKTVSPAEINWRKGSKYIHELCQKLNLPVSYVTVQQYSYFNGSRRADQYVDRSILRPDRRKLFKTHFLVEFSEKVQGPLYIGNTSNFGLGLLKPWQPNIV